MGGRIKVEELGDRRFLSVEISRDDFLPFQKKLLELEQDTGFLDTRFFSETEGERMLVDFTEFQSLEEYLWEHGEVPQVITILIRLCEELRKAENFLFSMDQIPISLKTIYVNPEKGTIRLAYLSDFVREGTLQDHFLSLLSEMGSFGISGEWKVCGALLERRIREQNPGAKGLIRLLSQLQREYCPKEEISLEREAMPEIHIAEESGEGKLRCGFHFKNSIFGSIMRQIELEVTGYAGDHERDSAAGKNERGQSDCGRRWIKT